MYRGSTPIIRLKILTEIEFREIEALEMVLSSTNNQKVATLDDVVVDEDNKTIALQLSQEDTLAFNAGPIEIQLRVRFRNDKTWVSPIKKTTMNRILKGGVL